MMYRDELIRRIAERQDEREAHKTRIAGNVEIDANDDTILALEIDSYPYPAQTYLDRDEARQLRDALTQWIETHR